jgi:hypothetical protein
LIFFSQVEEKKKFVEGLKNLNEKKLMKIDCKKKVLEDLKKRFELSFGKFSN